METPRTELDAARLKRLEEFIIGKSFEEGITEEEKAKLKGFLGDIAELRTTLSRLDDILYIAKKFEGTRLY
jgi:hypothetical protein